MGSQTLRLAGSIVYGLLVFAGAACLGFVVMPFLGMTSGFFTIEAEADGFFSLLTLKGVPFLTALSTLSVPLYPRIAPRSLWLRATLLGLNAFAAWLLSASIALAILG